MKYGLSTSCGIFTATSCIATFVAAILHTVAMGSRRWIVSVEESPFTSIGYHQACFDNCRAPYCPSSDDSLEVYYDGCKRLIDWYFQEIWWWLMPDWFEMCRLLAFINTPLIFVNFILLAVCTSLAFKGRYTTDTNLERVAKTLQILLFIVAILIMNTILINMVIMIMFYTHGFQRDWMPMPEKNAFGWSYWLEFTATVLLTGAVLCVIYAAILKTLWLYSDRDPRYAEDMMTGRPSPSPAPATTGTGAGALGHALRGLPHKTV